MSKVAIIYHSYQGVTENLVDFLEEGIESGGGEGEIRRQAIHFPPQR